MSLFGQKLFCLSVNNNSNQKILSVSFIVIVFIHAPSIIGIFCHQRKFMREFFKIFSVGP
jgi:hypothetical protein